MAKKYEVTVSFTRKVGMKQLSKAVKQATKAKVKGFRVGNLSTHESYDEPVPMRTTTRRKK